jgi:hypothetical protein
MEVQHVPVPFVRQPEVCGVPLAERQRPGHRRSGAKVVRMGNLPCRPLNHALIAGQDRAGTLMSDGAPAS